MNTFEISPEIQQIMQEIDRLIAEMTVLRRQVAALSRGSTFRHSVRQAEYFGMWANREEMVGRSSRAWLEELRRQQWVHQ